MENKEKPPIREERLGSIIAYGGGAKELLGATKAKCLRQAERSFSQTTFCQQWLALFTLQAVRDSVSIVHGPVGCAASIPCVNIFNRLGQILRGQFPPHNNPWFSTNLSQEETIHGGETNLKEAIVAAEQRYSPQAIFVFTSCVSGIIGDDIDRIISQIQPQIRGALVPVHCEGFRSKVWATGYDSAFYALLKYLVEPPRQRRNGLINVINPLSVGRVDEIERLFSFLGIKANFIPSFSTVEQLRHCSEASASISICPTYSEYLSRGLEERFGIPYVESVMPIGLENTARWLRELAVIVGKEKEAETLIHEELNQVEPQVRDLRDKLAGKRVYISGGQSRAVAIPLLAADLGLQLIGITSYHHDQVGLEGLQCLTGRYQDFPVHIANVQPFEQSNLLNRLQPDIFVGHLGISVWAAKQGFPTSTILDYLSLYVGFRGLVSFGQKLLKALSNTTFSRKLSNHVQLPYRANWYEKEPLSYLSHGGE